MEWTEEGRGGRTWRTGAGPTHVVVTRHIDYEAHDWLMRIDRGPLVRLTSRDLEEAKAEALGIVKRQCEATLAALAGRPSP